MSIEPKQGFPAGIIWAITFCLIVFLGYKCLVFYDSFCRRDYMRKLDECFDNCKRITTALQLYSNDSGGKLPDRIIQLYPKYLKEIPKCPGAGYDTYSESYKVARDNQVFTFFCKGLHHKELENPENYPRCTSFEGLHMKPGY